MPFATLGMTAGGVNADCIRTIFVRVLAGLLLFSTSVMAQEISLLPIATGLEMPVAITHAHDARLFITQQRGVVLIHDGTGLLSSPFLDIRSKVQCCGERGLLSVAFHPDYRQNGFFYVDYTDLTGDIVIARYRVSSDPNLADADSEAIVLTINHRSSGIHNGGQLAFGPDGYLYAGTGDGGGGGDPLDSGQDLRTLLGKILRIDVDSASPYAVPVSNPFVGQGNRRGEIWSYGLRNPWRFSFDRGTGDLFIADVGQGAWEEVDYQPAASAGGENYGWNIMEGTHCYAATTCNQSGKVLPIIEYGHTGGACSVTGGYRYRGARYPRFQGMYVYADYCNGMIWGATRMQSGSWGSTLLLDAPFSISSFGEDVNGELYVADYAGRILRIHDAGMLMYPTTVVATATSSTSVTVEWAAVQGAASYEVLRSGDGATYMSVTTTSATSATDFSAAANTSYLYKVRALGASGTGALSEADLATTVVFSDEPLIARSTTVKAAHFSELRVAVSSVRRLASLGAATFTDAALTPRMTAIRAAHVSELRAALHEARSSLGLAALSYTDTNLIPGSTLIKGAHVSQLRSGVK